MHLQVAKHKIIVKNTIINDALKLMPYLQPYKQNLLNFRHHFVFGVPSKISSFYHYFTDKALNILFKWYIIRISFERVLRNIEKNLL